MRLILGALAVAALGAAPLAGQAHPQRTQSDSAATVQPGCPMGAMHGGALQHGMMGAKDSAGMMGMRHMMEMMGGDSAMMASMRFAPRAVLAHHDLLSLTPKQLADIKALTHAAPDPSVSDTAHMRQMHQSAAEVRKLLTAEQRARVEQLPNPCPMMKESPADSAKRKG